MMLLLATTLLLLPPLHRSSAPEQLRRERLPADVDLVVHFDFEAFQATELWRHVRESEEGRAEIEDGLQELEEIEARFGIDPFTDVRAVTLYKVEKEEDPTVVLFATTTAIDEALRRFQAERGYAQVTDSGIVLHTWREDDDEHVFAYVHSGRGGERVVAVASNRESALRAAHTLRGEEPNHAQAGTLLRVAPAPGSFLYVAAARIPHLDEFTPASQVLGLAQGIQIDIGEAGGYLRGHLGVDTASADDAFDVSNVLNGLVSLARLAGAEAGAALELLTGIRIRQNGPVVALEFEYAVDRLLELLQDLEGDDGDEDAHHDAEREHEGEHDRGHGGRERARR
jgi:hypothetical protein